MTLVPCPPHAHVIIGKWVFKHKLNSDGSLEHYKVRWVVRGFNQRPDISFRETFSPIVKHETICTVLTRVASYKWLTHQIDISNVFLHGILEERVCYQQPTGFMDTQRPNDVCFLTHLLYGLRQAPHAWFDKFFKHVISMGFV